MNFEDLPNDIHYHIINKIKYNKDLLNLGKMNRSLKRETTISIKKIKVDMFRVNMILNINADLNKHCRLCKKFKNLKYFFNKNHFRLNIDRKTNHTIFDTSTLVYFNIFVDDLKQFHNNFLRFLDQTDLYKILSIDNVRYDLFMYFSEDSFKQIKKDTLSLNRKDILIDTKTNINLTNNLNFDDKNYNKFTRFIDILSGVHENTYEVVKIKLVKDKKKLITLIKNEGLLIITKDKIIYSLKVLSLKYKKEKETINNQILEELETFNPDIPKVDKLVEELTAKKTLMRYTQNITLYLMNNNIKVDDFPQRK